MSKTTRIAMIVLAAIFVIMAAVIVGLLVFMRNQPMQVRGVQPMVEIQAQEPDSSLWGQNFPNQWSTLLLTEINDVKTNYGGSQPFSRIEWDPRLVTLFAGYPFSEDYNEERGHRMSLVDVRETMRISEKTPATCYSCKSSNNPSLWAEMGMARYDAMSFAEALNGAGYDTAYIGKWHLDGRGRSSFIPPERRQGFGYWRVQECTHDYNHSQYYADSPEPRLWEGYDADAQTDDALAWMKNAAADEKPFALFLSWGPPHNPYETDRKSVV